MRKIADEMKVLILLVIVLLAAIVASTPIEPTRLLITRPRHEIFKRSSQNVKGHVVREGVKGYGATMPSVRKGEYMCGNKVCKLKPGVVPRGCNDICQYPVKLNI